MATYTSGCCRKQQLETTCAALVGLKVMVLGTGKALVFSLQSQFLMACLYLHRLRQCRYSAGGSADIQRALPRGKVLRNQLRNLNVANRKNANGLPLVTQGLEERVQGFLSSACPAHQSPPQHSRTAQQQKCQLHRSLRRRRGASARPHQPASARTCPSCRRRSWYWQTEPRCERSACAKQGRPKTGVDDSIDGHPISPLSSSMRTATCMHSIAQPSSQ